ncbi:MAG: MucB/RseB C-terminal domain-containing protein [Betaproteobacteria bacterium]|jgi:sigma-E factor negative regulatory protein RseB|nr:MucB/RseB C-terminal domain-containing protein [Rhodocyclaceae bacterium]MCE2898061.1 MucB/RseB C-terminal domain-containing protein [Betaproteobacteria bacterium]
MSLRHAAVAALWVAVQPVFGAFAADGGLQQTEALAWLQRIASAARQLNYTGVFVYQAGEVTETSRIVHAVDGGVEVEKLEALDGPPREIIRRNDELVTYHPETRTVRAEKRRGARSFPALLPEQLNSIAEHYEVRKAEVERVAGFDAQVLLLEPRDQYRYGHKLWADTGTGLLLKAKMIGERHQPIEQFAFTQLAIGGAISRKQLESRYALEAAGWRSERFSSNEASVSEPGWMIRGSAPGFRKILEMRRSREGVAGGSLTHIVFSDGLASVSVFIEPAVPRQKVAEGLTQQGAINIYYRGLGEHRVTVLGETPAATVKLIANTLAQTGK